MSVWSYSRRLLLCSTIINYSRNLQKKVDFWPTAGVRDVLVDISKAFDMVYHEGLISKLQSYGINGSVLRVLKIS